MLKLSHFPFTFTAMKVIISSLLLLAGYCIADESTGLIITDPFDSNKTPISAGPRYFENLLHDSEVLIDKSLLIKEFLEDVGNLYIITCPRRWGKSINLDMIKTFLELQTFDGNPILPINSTLHYRLFVNGEVESKKLKSPLLVAKYPQIVENYLGKYPVIFVAHLGHIFINEFDQQWRESVGKIFRQFLYLQPMLEKAINGNSTKIEAERLEKFKKYISEKDITVDEFIESLYFLSKLLHLYHNKKVFIFIDEYHLPWEEAIPCFSPGSSEFVEKFLKIYSNFMEKTFMKNEYLEKGILTGIPFVLDQLRRSVFKGVTECNLLTGKFMEYYGFNEWETKSLLHLLKAPTDKQEEVIRWYGGYKVNNKDLQIFNTWSVANYLKTYTLDMYWMQTWMVNFESFFEMDTFRSRFHYLVDGDNVTVQFRRLYFMWQESQQLFNVRIGRNVINVTDPLLPDNAFRLLYITGYLTLSEDFQSDLKYFKMRFPNEEIRLGMKNNLLKYYHKTLQFDESSKDFVATELLKCMHNEEIACPNLKYTLERYMPVRILMQDSNIDNILHKMLCWLLIDVKCIWKEIHSPSENLERPQLLVVFENRTVIVHASYGETTAFIGLKRAQALAADSNIISQLKYPVKEVKYIGINVHGRKHVDICSDVIKVN